MRTRSLLINISNSLFGRLINIVSTIIAIPIALHSVGVREYGILAATISITTFFAYADFGLGSALVTDLSKADARDEVETAQEAVSKTWFLLLIAGSLAEVLALLLLSLGAVPKILPKVPQEQVMSVWLILSLSATVGIPCAIAQRVYFALRRGGLAQVWMTAGRISVVATTIVAAFLLPRLDAFVFAFAGMPTLVAVISTIVLFSHFRPDLKPRWRRGLLTGSLHTVGKGLLYSALTIGTFLEVGTDAIINAHFFKLEIVTDVDLTIRTFSYVSALISISLVPLWPAITAAVASGDIGWVRRTIRLGNYLTPSLAIIATLLIFENLALIMHLWLHVSLKAGLLPLAIAIFTPLQAIGLYQVYCITALGSIRALTIIVIATVTASLIAKISVYSIGAGPSAGFFILSALYIPRLIASGILISRNVQLVEATSAQC